jgi:hypothetical protein
MRNIIPTNTSRHSLNITPIYPTHIPGIQTMTLTTPIITIDNEHHHHPDSTLPPYHLPLLVPHLSLTPPLISAAQAEAYQIPVSIDETLNPRIITLQSLEENVNASGKRNVVRKKRKPPQHRQPTMFPSTAEHLNHLFRLNRNKKAMEEEGITRRIVGIVERVVRVVVVVELGITVVVVVEVRVWGIIIRAEEGKEEEEEEARGSVLWVWAVLSVRVAG